LGKGENYSVMIVRFTMDDTGTEEAQGRAMASHNGPEVLRSADLFC
jgi:hypothetical protein